MGQGHSNEKDDVLNKKLIDPEYGSLKLEDIQPDKKATMENSEREVSRSHSRSRTVTNAEYAAAVRASATSSRSRVLRHRIAFFVIGICALSLQSFMNVVANKALGAGKHASVMLLALYFPQVSLRIFTDYWTKALSYHIRIVITALCGATALVLLYIFMDDSADIEDESLLHVSRLCVLLSVVLIGLSSTFGEVTGFGYCTFYDPSCINFMSSGNGLGAFLGSAIALIQNELKFSNKSVVLACFVVPTGVLLAYFLGLTHDHTRHGSISRLQGEEEAEPEANPQQDKRNSLTGTEMSNLQMASTDGNIQNIRINEEEEMAQGMGGAGEDIRTQRIGAFKTIKLLVVDLLTYTFPLFAVYFLYNIVLVGFIAPSFDVVDAETGKKLPEFKKVYQYFVFALRMGVFLGKSSGWMHITKFFIFPSFFVFGGIFGALLAYAPNLMNWFILTAGGHWVVWVIAVPLGWAYGATSANILFVLRKECPLWLKEFALSNVTLAASTGQLTGGGASIAIANSVASRFNNM